MAKDVIIACDFSSAGQTMKFLDTFTQRKPFVKIGMELFYSEGPGIIREIKARGHKIFLDLKLHDIPNTVGRAMKNLAKLGVDMTNLHAAGGSAMMRAALEGLADGAPGNERATLIAVTQLTSISQAVMNAELLVQGDIQSVVASYAANAQASGLDGVVCSPLEAEAVKQRCGGGFVTVTPGIRYPDGDVGDQIRVTTPAAARLNSDYIVVGRTITAAQNPQEAYAQVMQDFLGSDV